MTIANIVILTMFFLAVALHERRISRLEDNNDLFGRRQVNFDDRLDKVEGANYIRSVK